MVDLLQGAKSILLCLCVCVCGRGGVIEGDDFHFKNSILEKKCIYFITINFFMFYCSINLKKQSNDSELRKILSTVCCFYSF